MYDQYVEAVYASTPGSSKDPRACGAGGFAALMGSDCISVDDTYKAVTLRGIAGLDGAGRAVKMTPHTSEDYEAMKALGLNSVRVPVKAEDVASLAKIDLRVILAVYGDADVDLSDAALVECDASATKVRAAAAKAGVPVLLRVDSEEALRAYEGSDGVAYEISRLFFCVLFCAFDTSATAWWRPRDHPCRPLDGVVARSRVAATARGLEVRSSPHD